MEVGIKNAKTDLSRLIKAALGGEKVVITHRGSPLVRLVPETPQTNGRRRAYGSLKGLLQRLPQGWDSPEADREVFGAFAEL
jgi:prevent-host-death family protein